MPKFNLLSLNTKLEKSIKKFDIITAGLALAPHARSGHNVCANAGFCSAVCQLWFSGRTVTAPVRDAMLRRTHLLFDNHAEFMRQLRDDLWKVVRESDKTGKPAYVRLNVASDLNWRAIISEFPTIRFYDYSKIKSRCTDAAQGKLPANYSITPSYSERMHSASFRSYLRHGLNVSVVFNVEYCPQHNRIGELPKTWRGFPVIDGDNHDLRHPDFDGRGNVLGLRFKGSRKLLTQAIRRGFVVTPAN